ncbi:hypothetical protein QVD17_28505 [Tagetes erecta]|uniref:Uncharacterized protein n=1 Tax=Tagetes erecta TaxID=13708 RepID=A0AAD8KAS2_TARER|nr:hypothetical protein QVD17_28505 [Tagetes erecta]
MKMSTCSKNELDSTERIQHISNLEDENNLIAVPTLNKPTISFFFFSFIGASSSSHPFLFLHINIISNCFVS